MSASPGMGRAEQALIDGAVDVLWAGPMRVMKHHDDHPGSPLACFAEIVCRDPFSIVGRYPNPGFRLADLAQCGLRRSARYRPRGSACRRICARPGSIPPGSTALPTAVWPKTSPALRAGGIDAAQLFEPVVEQALATGAGHLWHAASSRGRTTYTAFVTTRDRLVRDPEPLLRMTRAIYRTQQWIEDNPANEIAAAIAAFFPALDRIVLTGAIARYQTQRVWGSDPVLPEDGFDRLRRGLVSSGFIRRPIAYQACVDNRLALQVVSERSGQ